MLPETEVVGTFHSHFLAQCYGTGHKVNSSAAALAIGGSFRPPTCVCVCAVLVSVRL